MNIEEFKNHIENMNDLEDDGYVSPTAISKDIAIKVLSKLGTLDSYYAVPDGDGGVSIQRRNGENLHTFNVESDGKIDYIEFEKCKIVKRHFIELKDISKDII